ncbi:hypothetical protein NDU88_005790 [Pleurodeles waltl]|uniref:Uncharacterized protein n=1 Tax=Pleurodeles waltl TaxID=8319 RepID=A0AAV7SMX2_PLEWA|nr:hypothetical protein NDU88_005790 [Pleurodeles waltl]
MVVTSGAARGGRKAERTDSGWRWGSRQLLVGLIVCGKKIKSDLMQRNRLASFIAATTLNLFACGMRLGLQPPKRKSQKGTLTHARQKPPVLDSLVKDKAEDSFTL